MAISLVAERYATGLTAQTIVSAISPTDNTTTGNTLVLAVGLAGANKVIASVSDTQGNTWKVDKTLSDSTRSVSFASAHLTSALTTLDVVTITWSVSTSMTTNIWLQEVSGIASVHFFDTYATQTGSANLITTGPTGTLVSTNEIAFDVVQVASSGWTAGSNWSNPTTKTINNTHLEYQIIDSQYSFTYPVLFGSIKMNAAATWTSTASFVSALVVYSSVAVNSDIDLSVSDSSTVTDSVLMTGPRNLSVSNSTTVTDSTILNIVSANTKAIVVNESSSITENVSVSPQATTTPTITVNDTSSVADTKTVGTPTIQERNVTVSDTSVVTDSVATFVPTLTIGVSDTTAISEVPYLIQPVHLRPPVYPNRVQFTNARTQIQILDSNLNLVAVVKTPMPLNGSGTILRYSKELSDFGTCTFRISSYDPSFTTIGDIVKPHAYHVRLLRQNVVVWQGAIIENTSRTKDYIEVVAVEYIWYFNKKLINRTSADPVTGESNSIYRIFSSGTMATAVTTLVNETITSFQGTNHALASMTIGTIENPDYPPNMTNASNTALTGPWSFGDGTVAPKLTYDFHSVMYVLKSFGAYSYADFNIDKDLKFNFKKFFGNDHHYNVNFVWGQHGNAVDFNITRLGQQQVNDLWGIAVDTNGKILHQNQTDQASIKTDGFLEQVAAYSDIKDQATLNARVQAELPLISTPESSANTIVLSEKAYPLGVYDIGDLVTVKVDHVAVQYQEISRIVGISVDLNSTGRELTTVQTNKPLPWQYGAN